jgi:hypothetical protein
MLRLDDLEAEIARLERQVAEARRGSGSGGLRTTPKEVTPEHTESPGAV